jgi:lipid A 3-O-deacylase
MGVYFEAGHAPNSTGHTDAVAIGLAVPGATSWTLLGGAVSYYWDFFLSGWRATEPNRVAKKDYAQIGVIGNLRYRFSEGASPWFAEAGLGGTVMNTLYRIPDHQFSTAFQFTEQLSIGYSFGQQLEHELSLRLQHVSNGRIKEPNPGESFVRVRYLHRF